MLRPVKLVCEGRERPLGLDERRPRFGWQLAGPARSCQTSYELAVAASPAALRAGRVLWSTGRIAGDAQLDIPYAGPALAPRTRYHWSVRVWDARRRASAWSAPAWFETGLLGEAWPGPWITGPDFPGNETPPAVHLRREFLLPSGASPRSARLYITALGLVEPSLNGLPVTADAFIPGWTDYRKRIPYLAYDVTRLLRPGANTLGVLLGHGWWSATFGPKGLDRRQGTRPALRAALVLTHRDGRTETLATDPSWQWSLGPILENSLYHGETHDARVKPSDWRPAVVFPDPAITIEAKVAPPVRVTQTLRARRITSPAPGVNIFDFGQNLVGHVRLRVAVPAGTRLQLRFAEMLQADGTLYVENLRSARATDVYVARGDPAGEEWAPRFTYHGFRYAELTGLPFTAGATPPPLSTLRAEVLHSDVAPSGAFDCSDSLVNRLQRAIAWGQRGNFLEIPTDCPQRDERLGWSGDAQVFAPTALLNRDCGEFFRQWMDAMRDGQSPEGAFPDVAPDWLGWKAGNAGWADAGIIVPWTVWRATGRTRILEENYAAMARWIAFQHKTSANLIRPETVYGDWLALDATGPVHTPTPKDLIGTAYFARTTALIAEIAAALGRTADATRYGKLRARIVRAFQRRFITADGLVLGDTQTAYLLALGFDLVPAPLRPAAIARLVHRIQTRDWHLTTGFLGTPLLNPVLSACGRSDVAHRLLRQRTYPGWLYPILNGATTMWERWNSWTKERGFGPVDMNSFNHYAYGAVGEWLYHTVAGLAPAPDAVGWSRVILAPQPGGGLTRASASHVSPRGPIRVAWRITGRTFTFTATLPPGVTGTLHLPGRDASRPLSLAAGTHRFTVRDYAPPAS